MIPWAEAIDDGKLVAVSVLSGNRNFEGRIHALVRANYLASPPLVVAYALLGTMTEDITTASLGTDRDGKPVYLRDIWPTDKEILETVRASLGREQFLKRYGEIFQGTKEWNAIEVSHESDTYRWRGGSTYVQNPPYFEGMTMDLTPVQDIRGARILALLGDNITTDHISPAGNIKKASPAGEYLVERQVGPAGLQQLRQPARQPRGNDARHLRQYPHQERDGAGRGRRLDEALPQRRADADLRRRDALQTRRRAAGGVRRQGIRHGQQPRLGGEGAPPCWASRPRSWKASSASTAATWWAWACCP